nr:MAG TPA: hypothetical protein [Caudoviricetes sp.]
MIEYKVGEVFTTDEGKIVQCVRSNGLCSGCVFLTKMGSTPRCKAVNIECTDCSREDGQHVIFEEVEELKEHTEYPVGKLLTFKGKVVEVVDNNDEKSCYDCALFNYRYCNHIPCVPVERMDGEHIKFVEHVTEE